MKYITGLHALNLNCSLLTCGDWHQSALRWKNITFAESDDMFFKEYGIEYPHKIPHHKSTFYVANHIRALLDLLELENYILAQGMRDDYICNEAYTLEIFDKVYRMRDLKNWEAIDKFMGSEYYMAWLNYKRRKGN